MPYSTPVQSFELLCLESVAKNLGKGEWWQIFVEDEGDSRCCLSPFDVLPASMITAIFKAVMTTEGATRQEDHLRLLITKNLQELDLCFFPEIDESTAFRLLCYAARCHSPLKLLKFSFYQTPYHKLQQGILPAFPNLQVLNVSGGSSITINNSFMSLVASACPKLKSLTLTDCEGVTDVGIERLCVPHKTSAGGGICGSLLQLVITGTSVTEVGARIALERLIKLEELDWYSIIPVVVQMSRSGERRPLALRKLDFGGGKYSSMLYEEDSLADVIKLCPLLDNVDIGQDYNPTRQDMKALLKLKNLKCLIILDAEKITFDDDLLPVLKKFGHSSLEELCVSIIDQVNLGVIVEHCSKLRSLTTYNVGRYTRSQRSLKPSPSHLPSLRTLYIDSADLPLDCQPTAVDLSLMFASAPALVELDLRHVDNVSDGILEGAIAQHGFPKLERLDIESCPNVTRNVVDSFLDLDNPLSSIRIERHNVYFQCHYDESEVGDGQDPAWKEKIAKMNLSINKIRYCECEP